MACGVSKAQIRIKRRVKFWDIVEGFKGFHVDFMLSLYTKEIRKTIPNKQTIFFCLVGD